VQTYKKLKRKRGNKMAALTELGAFKINNISAGTDIIPLIYDDLDSKMNTTLSRNPLRHVTIYAQTGDAFTINDHHVFEIRNDSWSSPNNSQGNLVQIRSLKANQSGEVEIYYLR
jgi:hypothetical protein